MSHGVANMMRHWFAREMVRAMLLSTVLACGDLHAAGANPPVDKDGRPLIRKLGAIDTALFAENSMVMFQGKLYSMRWLGTMKDFYFQFEEYESGKKMPPFAHGYAYGRSFVAGDTVYVSSTSGIRPEEMTKVYLHTSKDMVHWQTREVLNQPGWLISIRAICA